MTVIVSPPVPKSDQRFDDWLFLFWKRSLGGGSVVPEYADNSAALAGGLAVGHVYRTGGDLKIVI